MCDNIGIMENQALEITTGMSKAAEILSGFESRRLGRIHDIVSEQRATIREKLLEGIDEDVDKHVQKTQLIQTRLTQIGDEYDRLEKKITVIANATTKNIQGSLRQLKKIETLISDRVEESIKLLRKLEAQNAEQTQSSIQYEEDLTAVEKWKTETEKRQEIASQYDAGLTKLRVEGQKPSPDYFARANLAFKELITARKRLEFYMNRVAKNRLSTSQKYESYVKKMEEIRSSYVSQMEHLSSQIEDLTTTHKEAFIKSNEERLLLGSDRTVDAIIQTFEKGYSQSTEKFDKDWN